MQHLTKMVLVRCWSRLKDTTTMLSEKTFQLPVSACSDPKSETCGTPELGPKIWAPARDPQSVFAPSDLIPKIWALTNYCILKSQVRLVRFLGSRIWDPEPSPNPCWS